VLELSSVWLSLNVFLLIGVLSLSGTTGTVVGEGGNKPTGTQVISHWMEGAREREGGRER